MNNTVLDISTTISANEYLIVELTEPIKDLKNIYTIDFRTIPKSDLTIEYRWSKDTDAWVEWKSWPTEKYTSNFGFTWLGFRIKASTKVTVDTLTLEWSGGELGEADPDNPNSCSCKITACGVGSGDGSFISNCNTSALYNTALSALPSVLAI